MRITAYLKAIMKVYGKTITGLGPVELFNSYITGEIMASSCCSRKVDERFHQKGWLLSVHSTYLECNKTVERAFLHVNGLGV